MSTLTTTEAGERISRIGGEIAALAREQTETIPASIRAALEVNDRDAIVEARERSREIVEETATRRVELTRARLDLIDAELVEAEELCATNGNLSSAAHREQLAAQKALAQAQARYEAAENASNSAGNGRIHASDALQRLKRDRSALAQQLEHEITAAAGVLSAA